MSLKKYLTIDATQVVDTLKTREDVLHLAARIATRMEGLETIEESAVYTALLAREVQGSTGFGEGIAIPHCHFAEARSFAVGVILMTNGGVDFGAIDGKNSDIIFFIVGPSTQRDEHIQILSSISRLFRDKTSAKKIRACRDSEALYSLLQYSSESETEIREYANASQMSVFVQRDEAFDDILELFTAEPECYLTVLEGEPAGKYLTNLPLFSAFWTDSDHKTIRIIIALLKQTACNNMIRRINTIADTTEEDADVLVTVSDLSYWRGSLSY